MRLLASIAILVGLFLACGVDPDLQQGDAYMPDGRLPMGEASERLPDASRGDGAPEVQPLPDGGAEPSNTCEEASSMGELSGDSVSATLSATGTCSRWFTLRATEDDSSPIGGAMSVKLTLTPAGDDFDLYAFFDPEEDVRECTTPSASSVHVGNAVETITLRWGEGVFAGGGDDSRTVQLLVVKGSGACTPGASYTLTATGHAP